MARLTTRLNTDSRAAFAPAPSLTGTFEGVPAHVGAKPQTAAAYRAPRASRLQPLRGAIVFATLCIALIVLTWIAWAPVLDAVADLAVTLASREGDGQTRLTATVGLLALATLGFVLAWWRRTHPRRAVRLSGDRGTMAVDVIAGQLRGALVEIEEIRTVEVSVENRGRGRVRVHAWLRISPEARIDEVLDHVDEAADWLVHHRLGLLLAEPPLAEVSYDELDLRATRSSSTGGRRQAADWHSNPQPDDGDA